MSPNGHLRPAVRRLARAGVVTCLLSVGFALSSCGGDSTGPGFCQGASGLQATVGESVTFTWSSCALGSLAVLEPTGRVVWAIRGRFESPVVYGVTPAGAEVVEVMRNLQVGTTYQVFAGVGQTSVGIISFTR